jgi:hypothetical protein
VIQYERDALQVIGLYTIVAGAAQHAEAPERIVNGMRRDPNLLRVLAEDIRLAAGLKP